MVAHAIARQDDHRYLRLRIRVDHAEGVRECSGSAHEIDVELDRKSEQVYERVQLWSRVAAGLLGFIDRAGDPDLWWMIVARRP